MAKELHYTQRPEIEAVSKSKISGSRTIFLPRKTLRLLSLLSVLFCPQCFHEQNAEGSIYHQSPIQRQNTTPDSTQEVTTLKLEEPIEREIAGGQKHIYQVALTEGTYLRVEARQLSIDIGMLLHFP